MIYLLAAFAGFAGAVAGWLVTGILAVAIAGVFGMTDFEGARGMFGFLFAGPIGGLVGMVASVWIVLRFGLSRTSPMRMLARVGGVLAAIALIVAGAIVVRLATLDTYTDTLPPTLEFEVRVSASLAAEDPATIRVELHTDKNAIEGIVHRQPRAEDAAQIFDGIVSLDFKTRARVLAVFMPGLPTRLFRLRLARDPDSTTTLGPWMKPNHLDAAGDAQPRPAPPDDPVEIRYRVRRAGDA